MTEQELLESVTGLCRALGLLWHHCKDSRYCDGYRGLPDLMIAGPEGVIWRELKSAGGETSADQDMWIWVLCKGGSDCEVWRPDDWYSGAIRRRLLQLA